MLKRDNKTMTPIVGAAGVYVAFMEEEKDDEKFG